MLRQSTKRSPLLMCSMTNQPLSCPRPAWLPVLTLLRPGGAVRPCTPMQAPPCLFLATHPWLLLSPWLHPKFNLRLPP